MDEQQILELVNNLSTADELRDFAKETLGLRVAHNAGAEAIRERILEHLHSAGETSEPPVAGDDVAPEPQAAEPTDTANAETAEPETAPEPEQTAPAAEDSDEEAPKLRLLKNKNNGRTVPYTAALAKLSHMVEV